jgi:hypothetical protein
MPLDSRHVQTLLSHVSLTREEELDCGDCLAGLAEFAERELVGAEIPEALQRIRHHLEICPECAEEYAALLDVVGAAGREA